jgi:type I restriction enzyme S subunit
MKSTWPTKKLGEICEKIKAGGTPSRKISKYWGGEIPFVKIEDLTSVKLYLENTQEKITQEGLENSNAWILPPNSVLFSIYASIGEVAINKIPVATNQAILGLISKSEIVDPKFLAYSLKKFGKYLISYNIQSTQKNLTLEIVKNFKIPLPPLPIQQKIVKILDTIQSAVEIQEKIIEKTKELKKSLMAELFNYGAPSFRKGRKLKKTEIGEIPEDWEMVRLGEVIEIFDSKRIPLSEEERQNMKGPYPYCGANGIIDYINDYIFDGEYVLLAEDGGYWGPFEESSYIMKGKFWVNNHAHIFRALKDKAINFYFMSILNYLNLNDYIGGATRGKLNQSAMRNIKIPLPPLPEQQEIADILQIIDQKIEIEKKKKELYEELFKTMLNKIMSQEINVEKIEV